MSDLIRREDVFKAIVGLTTYKTVDEIEILCNASIADSEGWLGGIRDALREVEYIPSAEPERKKGEWLYKPNEYDDDTYECSQCGEPWTLIDGTPEENNMKFCPNCGADMRGE